MSRAATLPETSKISWSKRIGFAGILFFLIKGLFWLGTLAALWLLR